MNASSNREALRLARERAMKMARDRNSNLTQAEIEARINEKWYGEAFGKAPIGTIPDDKIIEKALFGSDDD